MTAVPRSIAALTMRLHLKGFTVQEQAHLKVVQLLSDLLASLAHEELFAFQHWGLKLLKAEQPRDSLKFAKEPLPQSVVLRREIPGA